MTETITPPQPEIDGIADNLDVGMHEVELANGKKRVVEKFEDGSFDEYRDYDEFLSERGFEAKSPLLVELEKAGHERHQAMSDLMNAPVFDRSLRQNLQEVYDQKQVDFLQAQRAYFRERFNSIEDNIPADKTEDEAIEDIVSEINTIVDEHQRMEKFEEKKSLLESGGMKAKVLNWYGNLSGSKKIAATVALGAGTAVVGFAMPAIGAASAVVAAGYGLTRFGRGFMTRQSQLYKDIPEQAQFTISKEMIESNDFELYNSIDQHFASISSERIERAEKIKKGAVKSGLAAVAIGGSVGAIAGIVSETSAGEAVSGYAKRLSDALFSTENVPESSRNSMQLIEAWRSAVEHTSDVAAEAGENPEVGDATLHKENPDIVADSDSDPVDELPETVTTTETPEIVEQMTSEFTIEAGHGYTHEIMDAAKIAGQDITPAEAWEIHTHLVDQFGSDYISILDQSGDDIYSMGDSQYEVGLSAAGKAEWNPEAAQYLADLFDNGEVDGSTAPVTIEVPVEQSEPEVQPEVVEPLVDQATIGLNSGQELGFSELAEETDQVEADEPAIEDTTEQQETEIATSEAEPAQASEAETEVSIDAMKAEMDDKIDQVVGGYDTLYADSQSINMLLAEGNIDGINQDPTYQMTLHILSKAIGDMTYVGSDTQILEWDKAGEQWVVNQPDGRVPNKLFEILRTYERTVADLRS